MYRNIFFAISFCDLKIVMFIFMFLLPVKSSGTHFSYTEADRTEFAAYLLPTAREVVANAEKAVVAVGDDDGDQDDEEQEDD